jgi:hypothetical protein
MHKLFKILLSGVVLIGTVQLAIADRGIGKKSKSKTSLNIATPGNLRTSIGYNLNRGLNYKGSISTNNRLNSNYIQQSTLVTYQKGNTTYIIPYKHKVAMPELKQGYAGFKLIIRKPK